MAVEGWTVDVGRWMFDGVGEEWVAGTARPHQPAGDEVALVIRCRRRPWVKWVGGVRLRPRPAVVGGEVRPSPLRSAPGCGRPRWPNAVKAPHAAAHVNEPRQARAGGRVRGRSHQPPSPPSAQVGPCYPLRPRCPLLLHGHGRRGVTHHGYSGGGAGDDPVMLMTDLGFEMGR